MPTWLNIALACLRLAEVFFDKARAAKDFKAGQDAEIAQAAMRVLEKSEYAKKSLEDFRARPGSADDFLRSLEPKSD
jgi:hypothetical protein